jgi:hypothetical protein
LDAGWAPEPVWTGCGGAEKSCLSLPGIEPWSSSHYPFASLTELHQVNNDSINLIAEIKLTGHATRMEEKRNAYKILVGKPERERLFGRYRRRWENNIIMDLREIDWEVRNGFIWLRIGTSGGLLRKR